MIIDFINDIYIKNQTADYAVNLGLIKSKTPVNNGCFNIVSYTQ